jgi:hypothetical protein
VNCFSARARYTGLHWLGEFRSAEHGDWRAVQERGEPKPFATRAEAEAAAHRALVAWLNGNLVRSGPKAALRAAGILLRPGKKPVPIEVR